MVIETLTHTNYGKLKGKILSGNNIIYYKRGMEELSLNITNACPNSCIFCIRDRDAGWGVSNLYLDSDPTIEAIISAVTEEYKNITQAGIALRKVKICGYGEPILRLPEIIPVISYIRNMVPTAEIQIATSGWPYLRFISDNDDILRDAKTAGLTDIYLSINASDKEHYHKIVRPGIGKYDENAFDDSLKFGVMAKRLGIDVVLGFVDLPGLDKVYMKRLAETLGIPFKIREFEDG